MALRVRKSPRRVRRVPAPATIWQNHNFVLLLGGQIVSLAGTGASQLALPLLVLWLTHSPVQAAVAEALYVLPYAMLCLPAGALVDRWDRKRVMIGCDVARAVVLLSVPLAAALGCLTIWLLYGLALVQGTLFCFFDLAATASLLRVASREHLATASGTYTAAVNSAQLFGPTLGGFLYGVGRTVPFLADAVSYAVSALSLFRIQVAFQEERTREFDRPLRTEIGDGLTWLWHHSLLRSLALVSGSANLVLAAFPLVLILLAQRMHASAPLTGVVLTGAGAGGVLGSLAYLRLQRRVGFGWLFLGGLGLALFMWLAAAIAPTPLFLAAVALCAMASEQVSSVAQYTVRLALIPDHLRGRVNSAYRLLLMLTQPVGIAGVGFLVQRIGTGSTILVCALVLGLTLAAGLGATSLRAVGTCTGVGPRDQVATTDTSTADMTLPRASSPDTVTETVPPTRARRKERQAPPNPQQRWSKPQGKIRPSRHKRRPSQQQRTQGSKQRLPRRLRQRLLAALRL